MRDPADRDTQFIEDPRDVTLTVAERDVMMQALGLLRASLVRAMGREVGELKEYRRRQIDKVDKLQEKFR